MANRDNRTLIYSGKQVGMKPNGVGGAYNTLYGVQDIGSNLNFNLETYFELGQLAVYQTKEDLPDVEFTLSKVLDGSPLLYHEATRGATAGPTLVNRSTSQTILALALFPDTNDSAKGVPPSLMEASGLFHSSISYEISIDGPMTESITLVGNDQIWKNDPKIVNTDDIARAAALSFVGDAAFANNNDTPASGIQFRENIVFAYNGASGVDANGQVADPDATILPPDVDGITTSGTNEEYNGSYNASIQSITVSTDLARENINELGRRGPYYKRPNFPVDVTCAIEIISKSGDMISATERGIAGNGGACSLVSNLQDRTIRIATCFGERIYLGTKNKLSSVTTGGGGTDGSTSTVTYNFLNRNDLTVLAVHDPNSNGSTWWTQRANYLVG